MKQTNREIAESIIGVKSQPICAVCQTRMRYHDGAPEGHVPPHWTCATHGGVGRDIPEFATDEQMRLLDAITTALDQREREVRDGERERAAEVARLRRELAAVRKDQVYAREALTELRRHRDRWLALLNPASADETMEGAIRNLQQAYIAERDNAATARADAIRECVEAVMAVHVTSYTGATTMRQRCVDALESLTKEGGNDADIS